VFEPQTTDDHAFTAFAPLPDSAAVRVGVMVVEPSPGTTFGALTLQDQEFRTLRNVPGHGTGIREVIPLARAVTHVRLVFRPGEPRSICLPRHVRLTVHTT
jgi:hypothetical protein